MTLPAGVVRVAGSLVTTSDPSLVPWLDAHYKPVGHGKWVGPPPSLASRALSLARAMTGGLADTQAAEARIAVCEPCPALERVEDRLFCGGCGCGRGPMAELHNKTKLLRARCPLGRWAP